MFSPQEAKHLTIIIIIIFFKLVISLETILLQQQ